MKKLNTFLRARPILTAVIATAITFLGLLEMFVMDGLNITAVCLHTLIFSGIILVWIGVAKLRTPVAMVLCCALIFNPRPMQAQQQVQPAAGYLAVGILIIVGAGLGIIGCKKVKKCLDKIGKDRNNSITNVEERLIPAGGAELGAAFFWSEPGDCYAQRLIPSVPVVYTMCPYIDGTNIIVLTHADVGNEFVEPWRDVVMRHGLFAPLTPGNFDCYEVNRQPALASQVPITFNTTNHVVTLWAGGIVLTVERSEDLKTWEPFLKLNYDDWQLSPRIDDNGEGQAFYRFSATTP